MLDICCFSHEYAVRRLGSDDVDSVLNLCRSNPLYYEFCPPAASRETVTEDMTVTPPGIGPERKYFVGFYNGPALIAVMDLIYGYPEEGIAFIGFFMTDAPVQGRGVGSTVISDVVKYLASSGFNSVRLAWIKGNPQAEHFWLKNGFTPLRETVSNDGRNVILAEVLLRLP